MNFISSLRQPQRSFMFIILIMLAAMTGFAGRAAASNAAEIQIPALDIDARITEFPLDGTSWNISPWETGIGHLEGTGWFDAPGNIALGAHSWMPGDTPGIFYKLDTIQPGDEVIVQIDGEERRYAVSNIETVSLYDLEVLYPTTHEQLTLITCDPGSFDPHSVLYQRRVIVTAQRES